MLKFEFVIFFIITVNSSKELLYESFNSYTFTGGDWVLSGGGAVPIFTCGYGITLVQLYNGATPILKSLSNIPPHFSVQLIVDMYPSRSIDPGENVVITIDSTTNTFIDSLYPNGVSLLNQCYWTGLTYSFLDIKTVILDVPHSITTLQMSFSTNLNENWDNEGYPFRNLQLFYNRCFQNCAACYNELMNGCTICYTQNTLPNSGVCQTCFGQINKQFLFVYQGCLQECPSGYSYDKEYICQINQNLINHFQANYVQAMTTQSLLLSSTLGLSSRPSLICGSLTIFPYYQNEILYKSLSLSAVTTSIRLRVTFSIFGIWADPQLVGILLNNIFIEQITITGTTVNIQRGVVLYQDISSTICQTYQFFQFRIELNQFVDSSQTYNLQFKAANVIDNSVFWSVTYLDLEQQVCSLNCLACENSFSCKTCTASHFLYKGQCITVCPAYSNKIGSTCLGYDEDDVDGDQLKIKYLFKEFYDLSTTVDIIASQFTLVSANPSVNFGKGTTIYFSYLPDKRVFGGALTWIDGTFLFQQPLPLYFYQIFIRFQVVLGDDFNPGVFQYRICSGNIITINTATPNPISNSQIWGDTFPEYIFQIEEIINNQQAKDILYITLICNNPSKTAINQAFCAIQNMFITIKYYDCLEGYVFDQYRYDVNLDPCIPVCGDSLVRGNEECDDGNSVPFDGCFNCRFSCEDQCQICLNGQCLINQCEQDHFYQVGQPSQCDNFCSNQNILCKICGCEQYAFQFVEQYSIQSCSLECSICSDDNQCLECIDNYQINTITQTCENSCGDLVINENEECDDGNSYPFDGCFNCKYYYQDLYNDFDSKVLSNQCNVFYNTVLPSSCNIFCQIKESRLCNICEQCSQSLINKISQQICQIECNYCYNGICLQCIDNYYLNSVTLNCDNNCGDKIINGNEQCDDGNNYILDGCVQCQLLQYQQCDNKCSFCYYGNCQRCNYGYTLQNNKCLSICGDNLINKDLDEGEIIEQCDNPNIDGCDNCIILNGFSCIQQDISICWTCDIKCKQCIKIDNNNLQCNECIEGYYPIGIDCYFCEDNCVTCNLESELCTSCYRNDCDLCENNAGLYTDHDLKQCINQCGDGIKVKYLEQCDDGNIEDGDGCDSQCNLEDISNYDTNLNIIRYKGDISNDLSISNSIDMDYSCTNLTVSIDDFLQTEFTYNKTSTDDSCRINFTFKKSIYPYNIIHITLYYTLIDTRLLIDQMTKIIQVTPIEQIILDSNQQSQADAIANAQSSFSFILLIIAPLSILFGVFEYFWAVLEVLSWINNFYFLNVSWPFNVQVLFLKSDWSSIVNFPTYQGFNQPDCDYYFESPPKFMDKNTDPLFINNAQVPFAFILISITIYIVSLILLLIVEFFDRLLRKTVIKKTQTQNIFKMESFNPYQNSHKKEEESPKNKIIQTFVRNPTIVKLSMFIQDIVNRFQSRIKQTITLCFLDICMAITLQLLFASEFQYLVIFINQILALASVLIVIYQLYQSYSIMNIHTELAECPQFKQKYGCYYDGINIESLFGLLFNFTGLIRKILYIFFTVYFYYNPLLQTSLCFATCFSGVMLMLYSNPFETKRALIQQLISEGCVSIVVFITVLFAIDDSAQKFTDETKIQIGWLLIAVILLALLCEILTLFYEILCSFYEASHIIYNFIKKTLKKKKIRDVKSKQAERIESMETKSISPCEKPRFHPIKGRLHFIPVKQ